MVTTITNIIKIKPRHLEKKHTKTTTTAVPKIQKKYAYKKAKLSKYQTKPNIKRIERTSGLGNIK